MGQSIDYIYATEDGGSLIVLAITGRELAVPYKVVDLVRSVSKWRSGTLIQDAFPYMTPDEREFLITGMFPDEWAAMVGGFKEIGDG